MQNKKLYRSSKDRILGGVAGGLGEYLEIDPIIIRLVWLALVLSAGAGVVLYIIAWVLIPNEPGHDGKNAGEEIKDKANEAAQEVRKAVDQNKKGNYSLSFLFGAVLVIMGLGILFQNTIGINFWRGFWPVVIIIVGLVLIFRVKENK